MSDGPLWFGEPPIFGYQQKYEIKSLLHREASEFQTIEVFDSLPLGKMLVLDNAIQVSERDEFIYHEMLAHVPLISHPNPHHLLVIGGGDGGTLRRGLEHGIDEGTLVEIDPRVVEVCRAFLPSIGQSAFAKPNARLIIGDGVNYVISSDPKTYDVLLVDSTDPVGPAAALFSLDFLAAACKCLADDGIFVTQSGSPLLMSSELVKLHHDMNQVFPIVKSYLASIPSYPGVLWSFTLGSKRYNPTELDGNEVARRLNSRRIAPRYYSPEVHRACFALPQLLVEALEEGKDLDLFAGHSSVSCQ